MEAKEIIVGVINSLLSAFIAYENWGFYIIYGWKTETIITVAIGAIIGAIIAAKRPPEKVKTWIVLSVILVIGVVLYSNLLDASYLPIWLILLGLLLLLGISIILSCIVAYFELQIVALFSPKTQTTKKKKAIRKKKTAP